MEADEEGQLRNGVKDDCLLRLETRNSLVPALMMSVSIEARSIYAASGFCPYTKYLGVKLAEPYLSRQRHTYAQ